MDRSKIVQENLKKQTKSYFSADEIVQKSDEVDMGWKEKRSHRLKEIAHRRARRKKNHENFHANDYKAIIQRVWSWYFY